MHIADADGCYIFDGAGKRYLDFSSQLMCCNLGYKNQAVIRFHRQAGAAAELCDAWLCHRGARSYPSCCWKFCLQA